jgi:hypothetical protein
MGSKIALAIVVTFLIAAAYNALPLLTTFAGKFTN